MKKFKLLLSVFMLFAVLNTANAQLFFHDEPPRSGVSFLRLGATQIFPTGHLATLFEPSTAFHIGLEMYFHNWLVGIQGDIGSLNPKPHLSKQSMNADYSEISLLLGYAMIRANRLSITPFVNMSFPRYSRGRLDINESIGWSYMDVEHFFALGPGLRVNFELFIRHSPFVLQLDVGHTIPVAFHYNPVRGRGDLFYARLALALWMPTFF